MRLEFESGGIPDNQMRGVRTLLEGMLGDKLVALDNHRALFNMRHATVDSKLMQEISGLIMRPIAMVLDAVGNKVTMDDGTNYIVGLTGDWLKLDE